MELKKLCKDAHTWAKGKGWRTDKVDKSFLPTELCLMHSELSEALEEYRRDRDPHVVYYKDQKPMGIPIELADVVIRIADTCEHYGINLEEAIEMKMAYNQKRPYKHGGLIC